MDTNTNVRFRWCGHAPLGLPAKGFTVSWNPLVKLPCVGETITIHIITPYFGEDDAEVEVTVDRVTSGVTYTPHGSEMMAVLWVRRT